ncbi:Uncharacterised protein [Mycobacterium tuberculosis]|nr:Uncharacterised protein [Mycobacterium tuberculosis]
MPPYCTSRSSESLTFFMVTRNGRWLAVSFV